MMVHADWSGLRQSHWYEYAVRFVLGGSATVIAGLIGERWGPDVGGLFLAFPVIFCASATLIEKHERERKQRLGLQGYRRGTDAAALDAAGAAIGSVGLAAFAIAVWLLAGEFGFASLAFASLVWPCVAIAGWRLRRGLRRTS
jgi:Protein of unknown function (DUF3147)